MAQSVDGGGVEGFPLAHLWGFEPPERGFRHVDPKGVPNHIGVASVQVGRCWPTSGDWI